MDQNHISARASRRHVSARVAVDVASPYRQDAVWRWQQEALTYADEARRSALAAQLSVDEVDRAHFLHMAKSYGANARIARLHVAAYAGGLPYGAESEAVTL